MGRKHNRGSSLFTEGEIADYSDQGRVAEDAQPQGPQPAPGSTQAPLPFASGPTAEPAAAQPPAGHAGGAGSLRLRHTVVDDSSIKASAAPVPGQERFAMDKRLRAILIMVVVLIVTYIAVLLLPQNMLSVFTSGDGAAARFAELFRANVSTLTAVLTGAVYAGLNNSPILTYALVLLVGAGLGTVGAAYQGSFRNPLATPSTLGVMSGASCGMVFYTIYQQGVIGSSSDVIVSTAEEAAQYQGSAVSSLDYYLSMSQGVLWCLMGALIVVLLTVLIAKLAGKGKMSNATLVIAGQVFGALASSTVVLFRLYLENTGGQSAVSTLASLQTGDLSGLVSVYDFYFMGIPVLVCLVVLFLLASKMNLLAFGDDAARSMGANVTLLRGATIAVSTLATALIVSYAGAIGFIGFMVPHLLRRVVGPDFRYLLPASALGGAIFLLIVQYCFSCIPGVTGGIGLVTTSVGAVVFIIAIVQERKVSSDGWQ